MTSAVETAKKHRQVVLLRLEGRTWPEVSAEVGLALRTCQEAYKAWADEDKHELMGEDPEAVVHEHLAGFRKLRADAAAVYLEAAGFEIPGKDGAPSVKVGMNPSARVGALRLIADLRQKEIDLRQETGLLPRDLGRLAVQVDVRHWTNVIVGVLEKHGVPPEGLDEVMALLEGQPAELEGGNGSGNGQG
jgi:hypothetical protein